MRAPGLLLCASLIAHARVDTEVTLATDRPSFTEWSVVVPRGGLHRNAQRPAAYFGIPWPQVTEIGVEFEI